MKAEDILVGNIRICSKIPGNEEVSSSLEEHALLFRFGIGDAWYYSPKYHKILGTKPFTPGDMFVKDIRLLDFDGLQKKDKIFRLKVYSVYRKFLQDIVNPADFMLIDIYERKGNRNLVTRHNDVLIERLSNGDYDFGEELGVMSLEEYNKNFDFGSVRPFSFGDLASLSHVTREEVKKTYGLYLEAKNNN